MNATARQRREKLQALVSGAGISFAKPPVLLPASDYFDLAGEEFGARLLLTTGADGARYCLRPDFTLPIAKTHISANIAKPAAYSYLGPVFRQRAGGPAEFEQGGLELIGQPDPDAALCRVFDFSRQVLDIYGIAAPAIRVGSVALFEALLAAARMPAVWRGRLRRRFGSPEALSGLLERLSQPDAGADAATPMSRTDLITDIEAKMHLIGLSLVESRRPAEIADRYLEKQALAAAKVPPETIDLLRAYLAISAAPEQALKQVQDLFEASQLSLDNPLQAIQNHINTLAARFPEARIFFEPEFSPRLHYYTGLVFEMSAGGEQILVSGGQYDRLLQSLGADREISASGCAVWPDRLETEAGS
jgi:ATP phosphoribosyltransferase regulatory subunit